MRQNYRFTPRFINWLKPNEVFVFGSNLAGIHDGGASLVAMERFGAEIAPLFAQTLMLPNVVLPESIVAVLTGI